MLLQSMIVALLVLGCTAYAAWKLMPAAAQRALAAAMLRLPLPAALAAWCRQAAQAPSGCGCSGCDHATIKPRPGTAQAITFHPRARR